MNFKELTYNEAKQMLLGNTKKELLELDETIKDCYGSNWNKGEAIGHILSNVKLLDRNNDEIIKAAFGGYKRILLMNNKIYVQRLDKSMMFLNQKVYEIDSTIGKNIIKQYDLRVNGDTGIKKEITKHEIINKIVTENNIIIEDFIDYVIKENGFVGVGLVSLYDHLTNYIKAKIR